MLFSTEAIHQFILDFVDRPYWVSCDGLVFRFVFGFGDLELVNPKWLTYKYEYDRMNRILELLFYVIVRPEWKFVSRNKL